MMKNVYAAHIVGARTLLGMSQMDLALASGVAHYGVAKREKAEGPVDHDEDTAKIASFLESRGIVMGASETTIVVSMAKDGQ